MPTLSRLRSASAALRPIHRAALFGGSLLFLFLAVQLAPTSGSASGAAASYEVERQSPSPRLLSAGNLIALVLLAGGGAWALHLRKRTTATDGAEALFEPVGAMQLAAGQQLRLVRCGSEVLLLGVTSGQITLLRSYPVATFDGGPDIASKEAPMPPGFAELLRTSLGQPTHA